jgi:hypothetical protein
MKAARLLALLFPLSMTTLATASAAETDAELAARRGVLERNQQSERFSLELRQSQQGIGTAPADRQALEALQLRQRQEQDQLQAQQQQRLPQTSNALLQRERDAQSLRFRSETPTWGPVLEAPRPTPSLIARPSAPWSPTLP